MTFPTLRTFTREIGGRTFEVGTGLLAQNATGSVTMRYGDTMILATVSDGDPREGIDFFPLTVDFEERMYAIGKIPGSFFRREGRPGSEATLAARMTDRPIRPLFPKGYKRETQVVLTLLSSDRQNPADVFGTTGASLALGISPIPFQGPVSSVRVGRIDGEFKAFPTYEEIDRADIDLIVAGTEHSVVMIEAGSSEVSEYDMLAAIEFGRGVIAELNALQREVTAALGQPKWEFVPPPATLEELRTEVAAVIATREAEALAAVREEGYRGIAGLARTVRPLLANPDAYTERQIGSVLEDVIKPLVRRRILDNDLRADDRPHNQLRELRAMVGLLPRVHGSGVFQRGGTQVLTACTLGSLGERQRLDTIAPQQFKRYLHHYNFPPFSVGEARPMRGPGRREIGHGMLAERALLPVIPSEEDFPYTLRLVSDTLMSNGSSSMASVCGSTLALMDAGVPISAPVAGVAMGLITDSSSDRFRVLTDIAGIEDAYGDMDFKIAGTERGITALQLDIKLQRLPAGLFEAAFEQAREARQRILAAMREAIAAPREELSPYAPRTETVHIEREKIGALIGPGGRVIRGIVEQTGAEINVEDDGTVFVTGADPEGVRRALEIIRGLTKEVQIGEIYEGTVTRTMAFGAFVEILPGKEGLVHISDLALERVNRVEDEVQVGDKVQVLVVEIDSLGRVNLSRAALLEGGVGAEARLTQLGNDRGGDDDRGGRGGGRGGPRRDGPGGRGGPGGPRRDGGGFGRGGGYGGGGGDGESSPSAGGAPRSEQQDRPADRPQGGRRF